MGGDFGKDWRVRNSNQISEKADRNGNTAELGVKEPGNGRNSNDGDDDYDDNIIMRAVIVNIIMEAVIIADE